MSLIRPNPSMLSHTGWVFPTVAELLAYNGPDLPNDEVIHTEAEGINFRVTLSSAGSSDYHETTVGGDKLQEVGPLFSTEQRLLDAVAWLDSSSSATWDADPAIGAVYRAPGARYVREVVDGTPTFVSKADEDELASLLGGKLDDSEGAVPLDRLNKKIRYGSGQTSGDANGDTILFDEPMDTCDAVVVTITGTLDDNIQSWKVNNLNGQGFDIRIMRLNISQGDTSTISRPFTYMAIGD